MVRDRLREVGGRRQERFFHFGGYVVRDRVNLEFDQWRVRGIGGLVQAC